MLDLYENPTHYFIIYSLSHLEFFTVVFVHSRKEK